MSIEQKFVNLAINESNLGGNNAASQAGIEVSGAIGQVFGADEKDGFIAAGERYLDSFPEIAERAIECESQNDEPRQDVIAEIRHLMKEVSRVNRDAFRLLLEADWDERNQG